MSEKPAVSLIIPTHNRRDLLAQTLASVRNQSFEHWECIVIDDASSDGTYDYLQTQTDIRSFRFDESRERTRARNFGLSKAKAEFVLFLDDDDLLPESAIETHLAALARHDDAFGSVGGSEIFWPDGKRQPIYVINRLWTGDVTREMIFGWIPVSGQWLFRKSRFLDIGGWNEDMVFAEDHELLLRLAARNPAVVIPGVVHHYRAHDQWRPDDLDNTMTKVREQAISQLPEDRRLGLNRVLRARALREQAEQAYEASRMIEAIKLYGQMLFLAPSIFASPLTRTDVLPPLLKSFLGGPLIRMARRLKKRIHLESRT